MKKIIFLIVFMILILTSLFYANKNYLVFSNKKFVTTPDGVKIAIEEKKNGHNEVIVIAPGWFMCKSSLPFVEMAEDFSKYFDVISMDFRGHCKSSGRFTFTSREFYDLNAVIEYARKKYKKVYVAGFSLGSATAVITQYKYKNADKLILVSPPVDFDKIENSVWKKEAYIPTFQKFEIKTWTGIVPGEIWLDKIRPIDVICEISPTPILMIAGIKDPTIKVWHTERLFREAREPKKLVIFGDSIHAEDIYLKDKKRFIKLCVEWLQN